MADFMDQEAEESNDSGEDLVRNVGRKKKKGRSARDSEDEEEEEDEETLRNEMKDLINDDEEEENDNDSDDDMNRKRKRDDEDEEDNEDLDEDDYALIEENIGGPIQRKKKLKRIIRVADDDSDHERDEKDDREAIANELFDGDEEAPASSHRRDKRGNEPADDRFGALSSEESDDEDNFIVDDEDQPIARPRKRKGHRYNDEAMQQAQDIFGVEFDFEELEQFGETEEYDEEADEEEYEDEGAEEGQGERSQRKKSRPKRKTVRKSIFEIYEPSELERSHLTEFDQEIRTTDAPERFQLRSTPVTLADEAEIEEEADWIFQNAFTTNTISIQYVEQGEFSRQPIAGRKEASAIIKIREALKFMRNQCFEVPFIAFYRKEYVKPELEISDLWGVYKWDERWCQLKQRKANMIKLFKNMQTYQIDQIMKDPDAPLSEATRLMNETDIERVTNVTSFEELHDCWVHFQLYYSSDVPAMKQELLRREKEKSRQTEDGEAAPDDEEDESITAKMSTLKLAQRKDTYTICKDVGIVGLASKFGLTPEQFGENVSNQYQKHEVEQYPIEPMEAAADYTCNRFATPEAVLEAARFMVAKQLSSDPMVRKTVRQVYLDRAMVQCKPTKKGAKEIDESHPCYVYKYLLNKPVIEFSTDQFMQLAIAQKEGHIELRITIDKEQIPQNNAATPSQNQNLTYFDEIKQFYHRDEFSDNVMRWNDERERALKAALTKFLYPSFEKEIKTKLMQEAHEGILKICCKKLAANLKIAPYHVDPQVTDDEDFDVREGTRIMGFSFVESHDTPAFAAIIDGDGEVTDHLRLPYFMLRRVELYGTPKEKALREKDKAKLKNFILTKKPHVIAVGAEGTCSRFIVQELSTLVSELVEMEQFPQIQVELVDNELSSVYMNCKRACADFHDFPSLLRQGVSLARRLQDPLIEFSQLCTADEEILCLRYHPLQDHLPKEELLNGIYLEFVNAVNEVGVDVNRALVHPHTSLLVQFICGLGPRKAAALMRTLKKQQTPLLESRTQLIMNCQIGAKVFVNCSGFIKIDTAQLTDTGTDTYIEVLDSTRVHPEAYEWARKMAVDALEYDDDNDNDVNPAGALEEILENPDKLRDLDLDAFAEELERQGFGNKSITLYDIRAELSSRYNDLRTPYRPPNSEELFAMLTKETPQTLFKGKLVMGQVTDIARKKPQSDQLDSANPIRNDETSLWKCPFCSKNDFPELSEVWAHFDGDSCPGEAKGVKVRLDNGIYGFIPTEKLSDRPVSDPAERVQIGMTIHARVTDIEIERFSVKLACRTSDLMDTMNVHRPPKDHFYDYEMEDRDKKVEDDTKKRQNRQTYIKRIIVHPSFHNIDFKQVEKMLAKMDQGEAIIRPSSKGTDHLTLTWKVYDGINQHVDILEEGKDNAFSLGHQLYINGEAYEDLDEIIARYVQPMAGYARDLNSFRYFREAEGGKKEVLETLLKDEKKKQPSKIHYFISAFRDFPGKYLISYLPRTTVRHEFVTVSPEGYKYRKNIFRSVNSLFRWFKEHFRDPVPQTPVATPALRTPSGQSSFIATDTTPNMNQAIQRAAASMPPNMFNTLSQVTGQTPSFPGAPSFGSNQTPVGPSSQNGLFPRATPSGSADMTPGYGGSGGQRMTTPRNYPPSTPQHQGNWVPGPTGAMPPPTQPPPTARPPVQSRPGSRGAGVDWKNMAENWSGKRTDRTPQPKTPLYATPGASSQMSISPTSSPNYTSSGSSANANSGSNAIPNRTDNDNTNKGDQTPLVDEWP